MATIIEARNNEGNQIMPDGAQRIKSVFDLEEGEEVGCYFCDQQGLTKDFKKGEAFLAGPDHSPHDGDANYICRAHLDRDAVIGGRKPTT
jgi:hypothetical protein